MYVGLCVYVYVDFSANPTWLDIVHDADSFPTDLTADTDSGRLLSHFRHYQRYVQDLYFCVVVNVRGPRGSVACFAATSDPPARIWALVCPMRGQRNSVSNNHHNSIKISYHDA